MKTSLANIIRKHYKELNLWGVHHGKNGKEYLRVTNINLAIDLCNKYNNITIIYTNPQYAPELTHYYITLK
jgi:hypothetical protein